VTFPASVEQLPRPKLDGSDTVEPNFTGETPGTIVPVNYDIEGSDVGYRWFARTGAKPLFPFGYGLSYTRFERDGLKVEARGVVVVAHARLRNVGERQGADVAQVYLVEAAGQATRRLVGYQKVELKPGEAQDVTITLDPRLLANWSGKDWAIKGGAYRFALGADAEDLGAPVSVTLGARRLKP